MKQFISSLKEKFRNFDLGGLGTLVFLLFVFSIPFQKRIEFYNSHTFDYGSFIDYTTPLLYLVDFIFIAAFLFFIIGAMLKRKNPLRRLKSPFTLTLATFLACLIPSLFASHSPTSWSFFAQIAFLVAISAATFALVRGPRTSFVYMYALIAAGVYQSLIALTQFTFQHSAGLSLLGESPFNVDTLNVAKIVIDGSRITRAYGTFPHPNALAAFLGISLAATLLFLYASRFHILMSVKNASVWLGFIILQFTALLLTFSRSGWLGAAIPLLFVGIYVVYKNEHDHSGSNIKNKLRVCLILVSVALITITVAAYPFIISRATLDDSNGDFASTERNILINVSRETFLEHPVIGTGLHTFLGDVQIYSEKHSLNLQKWQYQPVHNIYLLIATETGVVGLAGFMTPVLYVLFLFVRKIQSIDPTRRLQAYFGLACIASLLVEGLLDHHPWDIHQSQLLFWLLMGYTAGLLSVSRETLEETEKIK